MNLKIGQVINLNTLVQRRPYQLYTTGFTNRNVFVENADTLQNSQDSRNALFVVLPTGNFQIHDQLDKNANLSEQQAKAFQARLDTEKALFELNIQSNKDANVTFGTDIILKHIDSDSYLSGCFECSEGGAGGFKIIVTERLSSQIVFKVQSFQSFLKQGDFVLLKSPLYIYNPKTKCYLSHEGRSVITFSQKSCVWTFEPAQQLPLVYLQHTRVNGYLSLVDNQLEVLEPKEGYHIYEQIWVDRGQKLTRLGKELPIKKRIRNYVDICVDVTHVIKQSDEYRIWGIEHVSSLEDSFQMIQLEKSTHSDILFLESTKATLKEYSDNIAKNLNYNDMVHMKGLIDKIINFLLDIKKSYFASPVQENQRVYRQANTSRQFLMRDLGSLDQLMKLICAMYPYILNKYLADKKMEDELGKSIFSLLYRCIEISCQDNSRIKIYMTKYIKTIFYHCLNTQIDNIIPQVISDMPPTLDLKELDQNAAASPLCLNFLGLLSKNNQNHPQIYKKLKSRWSISEWIDLNEVRWRYGEPYDYSYFNEWVEMCSRICVNRNLRAQTIIQGHFSLKNLLTLIRHPYTQGKPILRRFVALLHYCYVDTIYFNPVILDRLCEYDKLTPESFELPKNTQSISQESTKFIMEYLDHQEFVPKDFQQNENLLQVLKLLQRTISLGFWHTNDINKLLSKLIVILKIHDQNLMKTQNRENLLTIKVKHFILKIINTVIDFELDIRVKLLTYKFKKLYDNGVNIELESWVKAIEATVEERNLLGNPEMQIDFVHTLVELAKYPNVQFLSENLAILKRIFSQKEEIIQSFERIYLLNVAEKSIDTFTVSEIKQIREKLFILNEPTLKSATLGNQAEFGTQIWSPNEKNKGLIQNIWELATWMKQSKDPEKLDYQKIAENQIFQFFNQRQLNIKRHQEILKSLEIHDLLVKFLINLDEPPTGQIARKLLYVIYYFLTLLVWNSLECKNEIMKHLPIIKKQLFFRLGAIDLLRQLFDNNPGLIYNHVEFESITVLILDAISKQKEKDYYTSKMMDLFRCALYYNEKSVATNQIFLLSKLQEYDSLIVFRSKDIGLHELIKAYDKSYVQSFETLQLLIAPKLCYVITIFNIFGILIEDENKINLGKCAQIHPFKELLQFSIYSKRCWPLKRNIRAYMNKLYYIHDNYNGIMELIKLEELDNILFDLDEFIIINLTKPMIIDIRLNNPIRFAYLYTYVYLNLEEILISLYSILSNKQFVDYLIKQIKKSFDSGIFQVHLKLLRLIERIQFIKIEFYYECKLIKHVCNCILTFLENILATQKKQLEHIYLAKVDMGPLDSRQVTYSKIINSCKRANIKEFYETGSDIISQNVPLVFSEIKEICCSQEALPNPHNQRLAIKEPNRHKISPTLVKIFRGLFKKKNNEEKPGNFDQMIKKFNQTMKLESGLRKELEVTFKIKKKCPSNCSGYCDNCVWFFFESNDKTQRVNMSFIDYIKILLKENCLNPNFFETDLKIFFFKMIYKMIYSKQKELDVQNKEKPGPKYWTNTKSTTEHQELLQVQYFLKDCGTHQVICSTIRNCQLQSELELANQLFKLAISFLHEGNTECQNALLAEMKSDPENMVMRKLNDLILYVNKKIIDYFKITKVEVVIDNSFQICTNDTYDYFDLKENRMIRKNVFQPDTDKEIKEKNLILSIFGNLFDFLHLLCENNNVEAKKFIKFQGNQRNSVNLLETAVISLRKMLKILSPKIIDMPTRLLSFINQTTQLPCVDNQIFIAKTTLFEDMSTVEDEFSYLFLETQQNLGERPDYFNDEQFVGKIQTIYEEFINILVSISEGNSDLIYTEFQKVQPIFFVRLAFAYLKQIGVSLSDPRDIFDLKADSPQEKELAQKIKTAPKRLIHRLLQIEIFSKKIQNHNPALLSDLIKFFKSPLFRPLPRLIQIEIEGQQQFFCPVGSISDDTKDRLILDAPRTTQREKIVFLLQRQFEVFNQLQFKRSEDALQTIKLISYVIAIFLNVIICMRDVILYDGEVDLLISKTGLFHYLKIAHFVIGVIYVLKRITSDKEFLLERYRTQQQKELPTNPLALNLLTLKLVYEGERFKELVWTLVSSAVAFYYPTLYSILIFPLFTKIESLQSVFEAIETNIQQLTLVGVFGVAFFYIFSLVSLDIYAENIYTSKNEEVCTNWLECILDLYIAGTINSSTTDFIPSRFFLDLVYFIFFGLLFGNIISGLMTDTFKELRSSKDQVESDENNFCYICGINRQTLERNGEILNDSYRTAANKDLIVHENRHNRFNYLYYIYMLRTKDETEYTGLEYQIMNKINEEDISWIPSYQRALEEEGKEAARSNDEVDKKTKEILRLIEEKLARPVASIAN